MLKELPTSQHSVVCKFRMENLTELARTWKFGLTKWRENLVSPNRDVRKIITDFLVSTKNVQR